MDFDIDVYLNRFIPRPWLHKLPTWVSWGLGYRKKLPRKVSTVVVWIWTFIGAFCGISVVQAVFERSQYFLDRHVVNIVASFVDPLPIQASGVRCQGTMLMVGSNGGAVVRGD